MDDQTQPNFSLDPVKDLVAAAAVNSGIQAVQPVSDHNNVGSTNSVQAPPSSTTVPEINPRTNRPKLVLQRSNNNPISQPQPHYFEDNTKDVVQVNEQFINQNKPEFNPVNYTTPVVLNKPNSSSSMKFVLVLIVLLVMCLTGFGALLFVASKTVNTREAVLDSNGHTKSTDYKIKPGQVRPFNSTTLSYFTEEEINQLGIVKLPKGFQIQEEYKGIRLVRSPKKLFSELQLMFLKQFIDKTPQKLLSPGPTAIVTFDEGEVEADPFSLTSVQVQAYASGSYVFFNDQSFNSGAMTDTSIDRVYSVFEHEMVHISQFNSIRDKFDSDSIRKISYERKTWADIYEESELNKDFAESAGWVKVENDGVIGQDSWRLASNNEKTTEYGKKNVVEDMAESVSGVISTKNYDFSQKRQAWALEYLGETNENLKKGKYAFHPLFETADTSNVSKEYYDYNKEDQYKSDSKYKFVQRQGFLAAKMNMVDDLQKYVDQELNSRGWTGHLTKSVDKDNVITYKGEFKSENRDIYIEMKSYDKAINYIKKPTGTLAILINGYK